MLRYSLILGVLSHLQILSRSGWQVAFFNNRTKKEWGEWRRPQEVSFFIACGNLIGQNRIQQACPSNLLSAYISDFPFTAAQLRVLLRIRSQRAKRCGNTTSVNKHNHSWLRPSLHLSQNHPASCDSSLQAKQVKATQSDFPNKCAEQFWRFYHLSFRFKQTIHPNPKGKVGHWKVIFRA